MTAVIETPAKAPAKKAPAKPVKKAPAKPVAKKAPAKAPAKKAPVKPAPAKKAAPAGAAKKVVIPRDKHGLIVPSHALSLEMGKGRAHTYRLHTEELAAKLGYKVTTVAPFANVVTFTKGKVVVRVTYSQSDFVRNVEGAVTIKSDESEKWSRLNRKLVELARTA